MHFHKIQEFFHERRKRLQPLALATVIETRGSTYSKAGERMLIDQDGVFQGMLSGGCLEGDLAIRAAQVLESGTPQVVTYNLADDDELWGLGVGCDGLMRVFLQPLRPANAYEPFTLLSTLYLKSTTSVSVLIFESSVAEAMAGASVLYFDDSVVTNGVDRNLAAVLSKYSGEVRDSGLARIEEYAVTGGSVQVFYSAIQPLPKLLILGAGLDAQPLLRFAHELGWRCTVADHRQAYIESNTFSHAEKILCCPAGEISDSLPMDEFDLAIVMSHHFVSDRSYLEQLAGTRIPYIGLLGPPGRRKRLMQQLGDTASRLDGRVHGPAGLDLGGRGPAAIALSIVAEMQQALRQRGVRA